MATQAKKSRVGGRPRDGLGRLLPAASTPTAKARRRAQTADAERKLKARDERCAQAYNLRLLGHSYPDIVAAMPGQYSDPRHAYADVEAQRQRMWSLGSSDELQEALDRNDAMRKSVWTAMLAGDRQAALTVLRLEERRAKLLGLDGAQQRTAVIAEPTQLATANENAIRAELAEPDRLAAVAQILIDAGVFQLGEADSPAG